MKNLQLLTPIILLAFLAFISPSEADNHKKPIPSAVIVGTVYCDTCFHQEFSKASHFISGASVAVECRDTSTRQPPGFFRQVVKTDKNGEFKVHLPQLISKHVKKIKGCLVKLISSNEPFCAVGSTATSSSFRLKSKKEGTHIFSAGFFTFKPLKQPEVCDQKPSLKNPKKLNSAKSTISNPNDPSFLPPIQEPPTSDKPSIDQKQLPPLPSLPKLPPLPQLPSLPSLPGFPKPSSSSPSSFKDVGSQRPNNLIPFLPPNPLLPPPSLLPPNPLLPPPSLLPPNPLLPPPSIIPPILPTPPPSLLPPGFPFPSPPPSIIPPLFPPPPPASIFPPFLPFPGTPSPPPPSSIFPPIFPFPGSPPPVRFPPLIPGLIPSPPPPVASIPAPFLPPFPFQPTPGFPGVPHAVTTATTPSKKRSP